MHERIFSEPIPIMRTFEHEGQKFVYGYGIIFDSPDGHGTVMTRQFVESNLERLKKFPAVRFMHQEPLGQIVWNKEVDGVRTFIDDHGFHILVKIYDQQEDKWNMIQSGNWGFSWSAIPTKTGRVCFRNGECFPSFEDGKMWEISVVDSPSHIDCTAYVLKRSMDYQRRNLQDDLKKERYPQVCTEACPFLTCPYRSIDNYGKLCTQRWIPKGKDLLYPAKRSLSESE